MGEVNLSQLAGGRMGKKSRKANEEKRESKKMHIHWNEKWAKWAIYVVLG